MKKFFAIIMTICLMTTALCLSALPVSAGGDFKLVVQGRGYDGRYWLIDTYEDFEKGWNEAVYYATHLDEAWDNCNYYYETEEERAEVEGFTHLLVEVCLDWNADSNGSFGKGIGFKDGAIFIPKFAKMDINLCRHIINNGNAGKNAIYIDAGAQVDIYSGTVVGGIHVDRNADAYINVSTASENGAASIFGEGSLAVIISFVALIVSVAAIVVNVSSKKKVAYAAANNAAANSAAETDEE
jgi:hypothetical protein